MLAFLLGVLMKLSQWRGHVSPWGLHHWERFREGPQKPNGVREWEKQRFSLGRCAPDFGTASRSASSVKVTLSVSKVVSCLVRAKGISEESQEEVGLM